MLARPRGLAPVPGGWRTPMASTAKMFAQGIPVAAALFVVFPRVAGPLWGVPADHAANSGLSDYMEPGIISELSLSDAVAFRVDFDGPVPPPWLRYWRGPVLSGFDGRGWTMTTQRSTGTFTRPEGRPVTYTVTLEPHWKPWLFALDLPGSLPQIGTDADGERRAHRFRCHADPRPAAACTLAGDAAAPVSAGVEPARFLSGGNRRGSRTRRQGEPRASAG